MMRNTLAIITVMLSALILHPVYSYAKTPQADFSALQKNGQSTVIEIINPVTIKLDDGQIIALTGLDYPDLDFHTPGDLAVTAQKILEDFLIKEKVTIYQTKKSSQGRVNRMGHTLAHLARTHNSSMNKEPEQIWVQDLMLSLGLARVRTTAYNREMATQMLALENKAREEKAGLWKMEEYAILTPEKTKQHIGSYQIVEGTVQGVTMYKNKTYINFGHNWKTDFTLGITGTNARKFRKEGIEPRNWNGAYLRVHGWIESFNGPYIELDHPERVEVLSSGKVPETEEKAEKKRETETKKKSSLKSKGTALPAYNQ